MKKRIIVLFAGVMLALSACSSEEAVTETVVLEDTAAAKEMESTDEAAVTEAEQEKADEAEPETEVEVGKKAASKTVEEMLAAWEESFESVYLEDFTNALDKEGIYYTGYYNESSERIDMSLEDGTKLIFLQIADSDRNVPGYTLIMKDEVINANSFQEEYLNCYDVIRFDYYAPELSEKLVDEHWLWIKNNTDLSIVRNELYAKYGRQFKDPFLNAVFSLKEWYEPVYSPEEFEEMGQDFFTDIEKENLALIMEFELKTGLRSMGGDTSKNAQALLSGSWLDLDGDGKKEQVFYEMGEKDQYGSSEQASLFVFQEGKVNEASMEGVKVKLEGWSVHSGCYVFSMDGNKQYLAMGDYGPSDDNEAFVYEYSSGKLKEVGHMYDDPSEIDIYTDRVVAWERYDHICSQYIGFTYVLKNGKFEKTIEDYYEYYPNTDITALQDIVLHKEKDLNSEPITIKGGESVEMIGGDLVEWVLFKKVETGEVGWLYVKECECMLPDGSMVYSDDVFNGLHYFG